MRAMFARRGRGTEPQGAEQPRARSSAARMSLRDRLSSLLGLSGGPAFGESIGGRRRVLTIGLIVYLIVLVVAALAYNLPIRSETNVLRTQVETGSLKVASMQRFMGQLETERVRHGELIARREQLYQGLPSAVELPIVVARMGQLPTWSGGTVTGVEYSEPRWSDGMGQLQTQAIVTGSLREVVAYIAAAQAMLPTGALERFSVRLDDRPGRVSAHLLVSAAALHERPEGVPEWDAEAAWRRAEEATRQVVLTGAPFTPAAHMWQLGRDAGLDIPELRLAGIARRDDEVLALIVYDGEGWLARPGSRAGDLEVISVDPTGVAVEIDGRPLWLDVAGTPRDASASGD